MNEGLNKKVRLYNCSAVLKESLLCTKLCSENFININLYAPHDNIWAGTTDTGCAVQGKSQSLASQEDLEASSHGQLAGQAKRNQTSRILGK